MNKRRFFSLLIVLLCLLWLANGVWAMSSTNYGLNWFVPLTGSGGPANSTNYSINVTVGQTAIGLSTSTNYGGCLGYWCNSEAEGQRNVYLPVIVKNY
jgi:hypothetical protein